METFLGQHSGEAKFDTSWQDVTEPENWNFEDISKYFANGNVEQIPDPGCVRVPKWIVRALVAAFTEFRKDPEKTTLHGLLRGPRDIKPALTRANLEYSFFELRFLFRLSKKDAVNFAFELMEYYRGQGYFPDVKASRETILDSVYRHTGEYEDWIVKYGPSIDKEARRLEIISSWEEFNPQKAAKLRRKLK